MTDDEVRIDRKNFNHEGNSFKLLYGWKGDNNRKRWIDYEYQTLWSFFGGHTMEMPWAKASAGAIPLSPPLQRLIRWSCRATRSGWPSRACAR